MIGTPGRGEKSGVCIARVPSAPFRQTSLGCAVKPPRGRHRPRHCAGVDVNREARVRYPRSHGPPARRSTSLPGVAEAAGHSPRAAALKAFPARMGFPLRAEAWASASSQNRPRPSAFFAASRVSFRAPKRERPRWRPARLARWVLTGGRHSRSCHDRDRRVRGRQPPHELDGARGR